jgi:hypothetical protein
MFEREIASLNAERSALNERLKLAADALASADRAKDELKRQFGLYKKKVSIEGRNASPVKVDAAIDDVAHGNDEMRSSLLAALQQVESDALKQKENDALHRVAVGVEETRRKFDALKRRF